MYCARFATGASRQIEEQYVKPGVVRIGYVHFAFLSEESRASAEASECAAEQGKFWAYHDILFGRIAKGEGKAAFTQENLKKFAADLNLNGTQFNQCVESRKYADVVQAETTSAESIGVQSTPAFLVNGRPLLGAYPFEEFQKLIEAARK